MAGERGQPQRPTKRRSRETHLGRGQLAPTRLSEQGDVGCGFIALSSEPS
jgi:hypothetical protein